VLVSDQGNNALGKQLNTLLDNSKALVEEENPGIIVHIVRVPPEQYESKIKELQPDIYWVAPFELASAQASDKLYDMNPILENDGVDINRYFPPNMVEMMTVDGKLLAVTLAAYNVTVGYSKTWFDRAGLAYPQDNWTWDDFVSAAIALKAANGPDAGNVYGAAIPLYPDFVESIVMGKGGSFLSPDGSQTSGYLDGPATVDTVNWLKGLIAQGLISTNYNGDVEQIGVTTGIAVTVSPLISDLIQRNPDIGIVSLPAEAGETKVGSPYITEIGINASSQHPQAAMKYIYALTLDDNQVTREAFRLGASVSSAVFENLGSDISPALAVNYNMLPYAKKRAVMQSKEWGNALGPHINSWMTMMQTETDVGSTLTQMSKGIDSALAEARIKSEEAAEVEKATQSR
jgi:multiple sugar transport system substrate-binding protein